MDGRRILVPCSIVFYGDGETLIDSHGAPFSIQWSNLRLPVPFSISPGNEYPAIKRRHPISIELLKGTYGPVDENQNPMKKWRGRGPLWL
jgi:hypothetical protein